MTAEKYKEPKIVRASRGWFIALYYEWPENHPNKKGTHKRFEISGGVNYIHDLDRREKEILALLKEVNRQLRMGFDPFFEEADREFAESIGQKKAEITLIEQAEQLLQQEQQAEENTGWTLEHGMAMFRKYCRDQNLSERTLTTYETYLNNFTGWLVDAELMAHPCSSFDEFKVRDFLDEFFFEEDWSPRTYNNNLDFSKTLFNRIAKMEKLENKERKTGKKIEYEIDLSNLEPKLNKAEKNRYYTPNVAEKVKAEAAKNADLFNYVKWIYYSCMRPKEVRLLQVQHIDLAARQIKVTAPTGKTGERFVPICDELHDLIKTMRLTELPLNYYPFGISGAASDVKSTKDTFTKLYRPIKEALGLDDKYTLYGWKHTRVVNLLVAGFSDLEVMSLTGHTDYEGFKTYKRELVVDTTTMQGKTVEF